MVLVGETCKYTKVEGGGYIAGETCWIPQQTGGIWCFSWGGLPVSTATSVQVPNSHCKLLVQLITPSYHPSQPLPVCLLVDSLLL